LRLLGSVLTVRKRKVVSLIVCVLILSVSFYGMIHFLSFPRIERGWYVQPGDILSYVVHVYEDSEAIDTVIDIIQMSIGLMSLRKMSSAIISSQYGSLR